MKKYNKIYIAIPAKDEQDSLPHTLQCLAEQSFKDFEVVVCVNQPEAFWLEEETRGICERNKELLHWLSSSDSLFDYPLSVIDKSSKGRGWSSDKFGVGWARKTIMDEIADRAEDDSLILCLDADTTFSSAYLQSVLDNFNAHKKAVGLSVPYYHKLSGDEVLDRSILHYELYMRNYSLNMLRIQSPYSYTALGSAIVVPVWSYKAIGGMTPKKSGEDFYFLQKLVKYGSLLTWNREHVYPASRYSDRVFFGTGPALIKGSQGDWESYPIYHNSLFDQVMETYQQFAALFTENGQVPMSAFLEETFKHKDVFEALRKNNKEESRFVKACHDKVDGLRVLQFLKLQQQAQSFDDNQCLKELLEHIGYKGNLEGISLEQSSIEELDRVRNFLYELESGVRMMG